MADILNKVLDTAKKLRRVAKKIGDVEAQNLIVDLNLNLADLKMEWTEMRLESMKSNTPEVATAQKPETPKSLPAMFPGNSPRP